MSDQKEMKSKNLKSISRRIRALFRLGRCNIEEIHESPDLLLVKCQSPLGERIAVCAIAEHIDRLDSDEARDLIHRLCSVKQPKVSDRILFIPNKISEANIPGDYYQKKIHIETIDKFARKVIRSTKYVEKYKKELQRRLDPNGKILPITCDVSTPPSSSKIEKNAIDALEEFINKPNERLCCVVGSFGTGKTVLLYQLAIEISERKQYSESGIFPLFVDIGGVSSHGIDSAINQRIIELFGAYAPDSLEELRYLLGNSNRLFLVLDSLDEQIELSPKEILLLSEQVLEYVGRGYKTVISFRPEIFDNILQQVNLIFGEMERKNLGYRSLSMRSLSEKDIKLRLDNYIKKKKLTLTSDVKDLSVDLARRPLWLHFVLNFLSEAEKQRFIDQVSLLEYCTTEWSKRELKSFRPVLALHHREFLTEVIAISIQTGQGIRIDRKGKVNRSEIVYLIRKLIPKLQEADPELRQFIRWTQLTPDLTAESLAVSNLLKIDHDGFLGFSENIFFYYFHAKGLYEILIGDSHYLFERPAVLDIYGIQSSLDLIGMATLPNDQNFFSLFFQLLEHHSISKTKLKSILKGVLDMLRPPADKPHVPKWTDIVYQHKKTLPEEARAYEIQIPKHWPRFGSWYTAYNTLLLLQYLQEDKLIENMDLSFLDLSGYDLSKMQFIKCNFTGTDFSYSKLNGTIFKDCDLNYALFHCIVARPPMKIKGDKKDRIIRTYKNQKNNRSLELLNSLKNEDEEWVIRYRPIEAFENLSNPINVPVFLVDKRPVVNKAFGNFIDKNKSYGIEQHGKDIENQYYLAYLSRNKNLNLPVVYVSLIAATAYSIWIGKKLPSIVEYYACKKVLGSIPQKEARQIEGYSSLPPVNKDKLYPTGYITEWTYQIDDEEYWENLETRLPHSYRNKICPLPLYRRAENLRCEYLVAGKSYFEKRISGKNSKPATWINPDQGFRCVLEYRAAVRRFIEGKKKKEF